MEKDNKKLNINNKKTNLDAFDLDVPKETDLPQEAEQDQFENTDQDQEFASEIEKEMQDDPEMKLKPDDPKEMPDVIHSMLKAASSIQLLTPDQEMELGRMLKSQDPEKRKFALNELVTHNLRYVFTIAKHYPQINYAFEDMIQDGNMGLMRAAERFDIDKGYRFTTYATWWIRQSILRGITNNKRLIRLPVYFNEKLNILKKAERDLESEQAAVTTEDLAKKTGFSAALVRQLKACMVEPVSINAIIGNNEGDAELGDLIPDKATDTESAVEDKVTESEIMMALHTAFPHDARLIEVLILRYGLCGTEPHTLNDIGIKYGISRERVRQLELKAIRRLRNPKYIRLFSHMTEENYRRMLKLGNRIRSRKRRNKDENVPDNDEDIKINIIDMTPEDHDTGPIEILGPDAIIMSDEELAGQTCG